MSKVIVSPVKEFPGSITIPARLTLPQVGMWEQAVNEQTAFFEQLQADRYSTYETDKIFTPILCELVEKWELRDLITGEAIPEKLTVDTFPATPRRAAHELIDWVGGEIRKIFTGEQTVPNG